ncbi:MAG: hypothetical protein EAZ47_04805 [Bacteroidetes bacterium]|nr:MAG: hypothetical protein EAZ47_04805 [Bacteroidota bacterium]
MKKLYTLFVFSLLGKVAMAQFTAGNIVVSRAGGDASNGAGTANLSNTSVPVFLDEYTPTGTYVQTVVIPNTTAGNRLTIAGSASSEGQLSRSANGSVLLLCGYDQPVGVSAVVSAAGNRVVAVIDRNEVVDASTTFTYGTSSIRSAVSDDGNNIWFAGSNSGQYYIAKGAGNTSVLVASTVTNTRSLAIANGQLYMSNASGSNPRIGTVGSGLPTTTGNTFAGLPGLPTSGGSPYQFFFADLSTTVPGVDVLYIADDGSGQGIQKYSLVNGTWVSNGVVAVATARAVTGRVSNGNVNIFAASASSLVTFTDNSGYNATITGTPTTLATAPSNTAYRGVSFTPEVNVLPVQVQSFSGNSRQGKALLQWQVANETNFSHYTVEKSINGTQFSSVGAVKATGATSYEFNDASLKASQYYRLKLVDKDGSFRYSSVVLVRSSAGNTNLQIVPNPVANEAVLQHNTAKKGDRVNIVAANGSVVKSVVVAENAEQTKLTVEGLSSGRYQVVYIAADGTQKATSLLKQ